MRSAIHDGRLEIVDGAQRVQTLEAFIDDDLKLAGLETLSALNGFKFSDLPEQQQRKFGNRALRMIVLEETTTIETRKNIFDRINTSSLQATGSEVREGAHGGPLWNFIKECSNNPVFRRLCPISEGVRRRREGEELVLRFFAYGISEGADTSSFEYGAGNLTGQVFLTAAGNAVDGYKLYSEGLGSSDGGGGDGGGDHSGGGSGGDGNPNQSVYIPTDANGNPVPLPRQTQRNGSEIPSPDPNASGAPHTTLGGREGSNGEVYRQSATFPGGTWPDVNGKDVPMSEIDWSDHGRPDVHADPHQHDYNYDWVNNTWQRGPAGPVR